MRNRLGFLLVALLGAAATVPANAEPFDGALVDQMCTAKGWVPAKPYNPNNLVSVDPNKVNCALCHPNPPNKATNANGNFWLASNRKDVSRFCAPPTQMNRAPVFAAVNAQSATVGQLLQFMVSATDPDNDAIALTVSNSPAGATFADGGNGTGTFRWTPSMSQTGSRVVTFHATDAGSPMASATRNVTITVGAANRPPVLAAIGNQQVNTGTQLSLTFSATDPDGNALAYSVQPLPSGAALNGAQFSWTPNAGQAGNHPVTVRVTDNGSPAANDSEAIVITVGNANRPPQLSPIGNRTIDLGTTGRIALVATDPDQNMLSLTCSGLPSGAALTDMGNGTGEIMWAPTAVGSWSVTCSATDNGLPAASAQETFMLAARDPAPMANAPVISEASWRDDGARGVLRVRGDAPEATSASGNARRVEVFALLSDGSPVKLGQVGADGAGEFVATIPPFVAPCQVAAAANGHMGAAVPVTDAPPDCDSAPLMQVKAKSSCDGFKLKAKGRRAPPDAVITGTDPATAEVVFTVNTTRGGSFHTRVPTTSFIHALEVRVDAGGASWILPEAIAVKSCN
jgi:hypothetical protein